MPATLFPSGRPDAAFRLALIAAAVVGAGELVAVGLHYFNQGRARAAATTPAVPAVQPAPGETRPAPAALPATTSNEALSIGESLLKDAAILRERGDTNNALARLQQAAEREPQNPRIFAEMAMLYESMQLFDRSNDAWRKIQEIGPSAGPLYELADLKLKIGVPQQSAASAGPGFAGVSPLDVGTMRADPQGIPNGSTLGITEATITPNEDPDAEANLTLRVAVKARENAFIDHTKVKIQVYFYDTVNDRDIELTNAEVNYEWVTRDHDWKTTNPEILAVTYVRLKEGALSTDAALAEAAAAVTPPIGNRKAGMARNAPVAGSSNRKFAGYQIRVYYMDQLEDVKAEPTKLLNLFPPPLTITTP